MVDVVLFPQSIGSDKNAARQDRPNNNMITIGSNASNSAFKQAYESTQPKRDYISLVASSIPLDAGSDRNEDQLSDQDLVANRLQTLQPRGSSDDDVDDIYPYSNPSPQISKPTVVGGL